MNNQMKRILSMLTIVAAATATFTGCGRQAETQSTDPYETGGQTNRIVDPTTNAAARAGAATQDATGRAMEETGDAMQDAGDTLQR